MVATDNFLLNSKGLASPYTQAVAIVPHNTTELGYITRAIYVGVGGDIVLITADDDTVTFTGVVTGTVLPIRVKVVKATGTTATNLVAMD